MSESILDRIVRDKRDEVAETCRELPLGELRELVGGLAPRGEGRFAVALRRADRMALIGEIKKASPSRGLIREDFDPGTLAREYAIGCADALSVLTERKYFRGDREYLGRAREASGLPVLRKDFIISDYQIWESRLIGADCILLICAALEPDELRDFTALAHELGLDVLVEVHNENELEMAAESGSGIIGVNNRDLRTFEVTIKTSERLAPQMPAGAILVSESGIRRHEDIRRLRAAGYHAVLVGEHLMRADDIAAATRKLILGEP